MDSQASPREYFRDRPPLIREMTAIVGRAACLLAVGALLGFLANAIRPHGVDLRAAGAAQAASACVQPAGAIGPEGGRAVDIVTAGEAAGLCGDPRTLVADTRTAAEFAQGHVTGAIHLPCASSRGAASAALDLLAGRQALIVYGNGTEDATPVAEELRRRSGHPDVRVSVLAGGFRAWSDAGLACSSGPCADCQAPGHP